MITSLPFMTLARIADKWSRNSFCCYSLHNDVFLLFSQAHVLRCFRNKKYYDRLGFDKVNIFPF